MSQAEKVEEKIDLKGIEPDTTCIFWPIPCPVMTRKESVKDQRMKAQAVLASLKPMSLSGLSKDLDSFMEKLVPLFNLSSMGMEPGYCVACASFNYPSNYEVVRARIIQEARGEENEM